MSDTILWGDFNARMATLTGESTSIARGRHHASWMEDRHLALWNSSTAYAEPTFRTFRNHREHQSIIDIFLSNFTRQWIRSPPGANDLPTGSD
ncbi:hypothetical protein BGW37DRAFT_559989 [Umbelopsis sp. PMI_123]|nr:hypothetical protein BGW37DRAFT_559989 [Umbelopsis sp. PMI_123]